MAGQSMYVLTSDAVAQLTELLAEISAAASIDDDYRFEVEYSQTQVSSQMPAIEVLMLAGVLAEVDIRTNASPEIVGISRSWALYLGRVLPRSETSVQTQEISSLSSVSTPGVWLADSRRYAAEGREAAHSTL